MRATLCMIGCALVRGRSLLHPLEARNRPLVQADFPWPWPLVVSDPDASESGDLAGSGHIAVIQARTDATPASSTAWVSMGGI